jgi:hypothetical protein
MTTFCYDIQNEIDLSDYLLPFNSVVRFAYNRFRDEIDRVDKAIAKIKLAAKKRKELYPKEKLDKVELPEPKLTVDEIVRLAQSQLKNIDILDFSLLRYAVMKADSKKSIPKVVFGGRKLKKALKFFFYKKNPKVTKAELKEEYRYKRNYSPLFLVGCCSDSFGNRKAKLDIIDNNSVIIKLNRKAHFEVKLPKLSKQHLEQLTKLQELCNKNKACFSIEVNNKQISIIVDPVYLKLDRKSSFIENRILSFDLNPNYIGLTITDWHTEESKTIVHKEIIDITGITSLPHNSSDKSKRKKNKRDYETSEINNHIINLALHYKCELVVFEKLDMDSKDLLKGKKLNRLINNCWNRTKLLQNLVKRCIINNIKYQEVIAMYSSFIGQMMNEAEYDSIAASLEISRRANKFNCAKKDNRKIQDIVFPRFNVSALPTQWKKMAKVESVTSWKELYRLIKKFKSRYRLLFSAKNFGGFSSSLKSYKSSVMIRFV